MPKVGLIRISARPDLPATDTGLPATPAVVRDFLRLARAGDELSSQTLWQHQDTTARELRLTPWAGTTPGRAGPTAAAADRLPPWQQPPR